MIIVINEIEVMIRRLINHDLDLPFPLPPLLK
jgi:hypothetical protein